MPPRTIESARSGGEQGFVGFSFDLVLSVFQPAEARGDQAVDCGVLVVAGDLVAQVPPDAFDRVQFRRVLRQEHQSDARVQRDPCADGFAGVEAGVVADHVDDLEVLQTPVQVGQVRDEQLPIAAFSQRAEDAFRPPIKTARKVTFDVVARRDDLGLLTFLLPHRADLGIQIQVDLVLKHSCLGGGQVLQKSLDSQENPTFLRVTRSHHRTRTPPREARCV